MHKGSQGQDTRAIQGYMSHANIKKTTLYTELSPKRYEKFWKD
jgi:type 1 fimbriae regulatory protein FimB/type 1 fimbriae regulatory protein FimE